jgi:hypothetical protein
MSGPGYSISGFITRSNLASPLSPLAIQADPYWTLLGDTSDDATISESPGVAPGLSALKQVWADSSYVAGQQLVLSVPDNSTLDLRLICDGDSMADAQTKAAEIIVAITQQLVFEVSLTFDTATYAWNCYTGVYEVAFNQLHYFGYLLPLYVSLTRDPTPVSGPI